MKVFIIFLCGFLFLSCNAKEKPKNSDDLSVEDFFQSSFPNKKQAIDLFLTEGLPIKLGESRKEIEEKLGKPLKTNVAEKQNIHDPSVTDQIYELTYEGLSIWIYHVSQSKKDIIFSIVLTSDEYNLLYDLKIGVSKEKVKLVFGQADEELENRWRYTASEYRAGEVEFVFKGDKLTSINWYYYLD